MKHNLLLLATAIVLVACTPKAQEQHFPVMPPEMSDCKVFWIQDGKGVRLYVVRCPNSTTTTKSGKASQTAVIDGSTYQKVEE